MVDANESNWGAEQIVPRALDRYTRAALKWLYFDEFAANKSGAAAIELLSIQPHSPEWESSNESYLDQIKTAIHSAISRALAMRS